MWIRLPSDFAAFGWTLSGCLACLRCSGCVIVLAARGTVTFALWQLVLCSSHCFLVWHGGPTSVVGPAACRSLLKGL